MHVWNIPGYSNSHKLSSLCAYPKLEFFYAIELHTVTKNCRYVPHFMVRGNKYIFIPTCMYVYNWAKPSTFYTPNILKKPFWLESQEKSGNWYRNKIMDKQNIILKRYLPHFIFRSTCAQTLLRYSRVVCVNLQSKALFIADNQLWCWFHEYTYTVASKPSCPLIVEQ